MQEKYDNDVLLTERMFYDAINNLKKNKKDKYKFIIEAGKDFKLAVLELFKTIWNEEEKPEQWKLDTLVQIHKKGSTVNLDNFRFIHIKDDIPKLFGYIVTNEIKARIVDNISKYQIGAVPGHRPQEHLFCIRSIIALYQQIKKPLILSFFDISKFFDSEVLEDALDACYDAGVIGKLYRLLYLMNSDAKIKVRTALGETEIRETGDNVAQGTVEGATVSSANVDKGINYTFANSYKEISYG